MGAGPGTRGRWAGDSRVLAAECGRDGGACDLVLTGERGETRCDPQM